MARYYFNVRQGDRIIPDVEGQELTSIENAWQEAAGAIGDKVKDIYLRRAKSAAMAIEICDEGGPVLLVRVGFAPAST